MNFKRAELELKKSSCQTRIDVKTKSILNESSRDHTSSIRLDSFSALSLIFDMSIFKLTEVAKLKCLVIAKQFYKNL